VVPLMSSIQAIPARAAGSAVMMMNGSVQDWKVDDDQQIDEHDGHDQTDRQADERGLHRLHLAADLDLGAARQLGACLIDQRLDFGGHRAQVATVDAHIHVDDRRDVVVRNHRELAFRLHLHQVAQHLLASRPGRRR
jgi:hypothetical protein